MCGHEFFGAPVCSIGILSQLTFSSWCSYCFFFSWSFFGVKGSGDIPPVLPSAALASPVALLVQDFVDSPHSSFSKEQGIIGILHRSLFWAGARDPGSFFFFDTLCQ